MLRTLIGMIFATGILAGCASYNQASDADKIDAAVTATCPSSDNLGQLRLIPFGGSGSSLIEFMRFQFGGASAAWGILGGVLSACR